MARGKCVAIKNRGACIEDDKGKFHKWVGYYNDGSH